ncbi:hypothetical protein [Parvularcula oceani]|uniref:baeRF3 domain-containing protein n=1 Tax=Parvularcula oceani TaxID=1247963 RepID=UPI0004E16B33|nr:hypothetical protein [Parvularcula oceani]
MTLLEDRISSLSPLIADPAAPGADPAAGKTRDVVSLLYPTPDIAGDMQKWGIAQKNILDRLDETEGLDQAAVGKLRAWVEAMDPEHLPEGGFALFAEGGEMSAHTLNVRPAPTLHKGPLYALPALVDAACAMDYWVVVLDVEAPRIFSVSGTTWTDKTPKSGVRTLSGEMAQYAPMDSVTFHSSGRPHIGKAGHAAAKFHALGTSVSDYKAEEVERVLQDFAGHVEKAVGGGGRPVLLAGDPKRTGLFRQHFDDQNLVEPDLHVAGDALALEELAGRAREAMEDWDRKRRGALMDDLDPNTLERNEQQLLSAAREGRIDTVYLREDAAGLIPGDDERLKIGSMEEEGAETRSMIVGNALKNGASLTLFSEDMAPDLPIIAASMRY